jgi:hypothetical protein
LIIVLGEHLGYVCKTALVSRFRLNSRPSKSLQDWVQAHALIISYESVQEWVQAHALIVRSKNCVVFFSPDEWNVVNQERDAH